MRIKIVSNGIGSGGNTKVVNAETGELVEHVQKAEWECKVGELATVKLTFVNVPVEIEGDCPQDITAFEDEWRKYTSPHVR